MSGRETNRPEARDNRAGEFDSKPYVEYEPEIGYRYLPNLSIMLPRPGGGNYHFQTNSRGIRSSREYSFKKPPGAVRIIVCGDSMSGGQFVSNEQRFSEQLERSVRGLEVINLSLEGSGTDQQLLIYESIGLQYEHDCVVLMPFLSNLRRNMVSARKAFDAKTGSRILRGKPRFELMDGQLELRNVPVPREYPTATAATLGISTDTPTNISHQLKAIVGHLPGVSFVKKVVYFLSPWEPFPEFCNANSPEWRLMEAIVRRFRTSADSKPIIIIPTFYDNYVRYRMARNYWYRFSSLTKIPGITVVDLLPHFLKLGGEGLRCFQSPHDVHFSSFGHLVLAEVLKSELARIGILREL